MTQDITRTTDYRDFIRSLKQQKVQSAQIKVARAVSYKEQSQFVQQLVA
jgi:hypothetical protein